MLEERNLTLELDNQEAREKLKEMNRKQREILDKEARIDVVEDRNKKEKSILLESHETTLLDLKNKYSDMIRMSDQRHKKETLNLHEKISTLTKLNDKLEMESKKLRRDVEQA